ncbi:MAG: preprotein translocase subunit SecG [Candidatus Dormibacteria bacterium]
MKHVDIHGILQVAEFVVSIFLILGVLLQTPKSSTGLGGTIGGAGDSGGGYRTKRGIEKSLFQVTIGLTIMFVLISVVNITAK